MGVVRAVEVSVGPLARAVLLAEHAQQVGAVAVALMRTLAVSVGPLAGAVLLAEHAQQAATAAARGGKKVCKKPS